ncbi:MAG: hypothetical protein HY682_03315 [Chloroflexi bacterium]|nr:hypothetical protein [Chloroflexota bacterium]
MKLTRRSVIGLVPSLLIALVVACGGGGASPTATPAGTPKAAPAESKTEQKDTAGVKVAPELQQTPTAAAGAEAEGVKQGGVFKRLWADPPTLDPHQVSDTTSAAIVVEIFSGLVRLGTDLKIEPELAESYTVSNNGTVYEFKLRPDLKFSDGSQVTAQDFKWSLERAAHPDTESTVAETYLAHIVGL